VREVEDVCMREVEEVCMREVEEVCMREVRNAESYATHAYLPQEVCHSYVPRRYATHTYQ